MIKKRKDAIKLIISIFTVIALFTFITFTTKETFNPEDNEVGTLDNNILKNVEITQEPKKIDQIQQSFNSITESSTASDINVASRFTVLEEVNNVSESAGESNVLTINYYVYGEGIYLLRLPNINYSSYAIRWGAGDISIGETIDALKPITPELDEGETLRGFVSNLFYSDSKEIFVGVDTPTTLSIDLINVEKDDQPVASVSEIQNADSGAKYSSLSIISRDIWGASPNSWDTNSSLDIDDPARYTWEPGYFRVSRFVIHHTASPNNSTAPAQAVRDIYMYHAYSRGWGDIGYNYLIDAWGNIYEGKGGGDEVYGYHAYTEANTMSIGIALIGDYTSETPTYAAKRSLIKLLAEKATFYDIKLSLSNGSLSDWLNENTTVFGHKDSYFWCHSGHVMSYLCTDKDKWVVNNTACPGQNLSSVLSSEIVSDARNFKDYNFYDLRTVVSNVNDLINSEKEEVNWIYIKYDLPESTDPSVIEDMLPIYSGIIDHEIHGNEVILHLGGWNEGIPDYGWDGFYASGTFFPASEGNNDRAKTLMKVFEMDPDIVEVAPYNRFSISPIE